MKNTQHIVVNSVFYTIAGIIPQLVNFILLPVYTRYLTPDDYAILTLVTVFSSLVGIMFSLQLQAGISRFVIQHYCDEKRAKKIFSGHLYLLAIVLFLGGFFMEIYGDDLVAMFFSSEKLAYRPQFQIGIWTVIVTLLQSACQVLIRVQEGAKKYLVLNLFYVTFNTFLSLIAVIYLNSGTVGILWANLIATLLSLLTFLYVVRDWLCFAFPVSDIVQSLKYSIPLIPHAIAGYLFMYSDRIILEKYVSIATIGVYALADRLATIMKLLVNSFNDAYSPYFMKKAETNPTEAKEETSNVILWWWVIYIFFLFGLIVFSQEIILIFTEERYYEAADYLPVLASAYLFRGLYCFSINGIFFKRKSWVIACVTLIAGISNVLLNLWLVPRFGAYGAAWTTVISFFLTFLLSYLFNSRFFPITFPWKAMGGGILIFGCGLIGYYSIISLVSTFLLRIFLKLTLVLFFGLFLFSFSSSRIGKSTFINSLLVKLWKKYGSIFVG